MGEFEVSLNMIPATVFINGEPELLAKQVAPVF